MNHVLLGGHPAIDFLNTSLAPDGEPVEKIPDGKSYLTWLTAAGRGSRLEAFPTIRHRGTRRRGRGSAQDA